MGGSNKYTNWFKVYFYQSAKILTFSIDFLYYVKQNFGSKKPPTQRKGDSVIFLPLLKEVTKNVKGHGNGFYCYFFTYDYN